MYQKQEGVWRAVQGKATQWLRETERQREVEKGRYGGELIDIS